MKPTFSTNFSSEQMAILKKIIFFSCLIFLFTPFSSPTWGLGLGLLMAFTVGSPFENKQISKISKYLLQFAVVGLGFGMNINSVLKTGLEGIGTTFFSILLTLIIGLILGKILATDRKMSFLISSGTAICGGSAIAALSPIISSDSKQTSVSLGVVFILNALALVIFPYIGSYFLLNNEQFAWWAAIAIHDTSSVVGAAAQYGEKSLVLATTIKLTRALWIVPVALTTAFFLKNKEKSAPFPYFMLYFLAAAFINTYFEPIQFASPYFVKIAKIAFSIVLFLIGINLSKSALKEIGIVPILQGVILWVLISVVSLFWVLKYF